MRKLIILGVSLMLFGCGSVDVSKYEGKEPKFTMKGFFDGNIEGYGFFQGRDGEIAERYYVQMIPTWDGNKGSLKENFYKDDGTQMVREWHLTLIDDHKFEATADDVEGVGKGEVRGYAMNMKYVLKVPRKGSTIDVNVDDWIFLQPDGSAVNSAKMSKFGFGVGELKFAFRKLKKGEKFHESYFLNSK